MNRLARKPKYRIAHDPVAIGEAVIALHEILQLKQEEVQMPESVQEILERVEPSMKRLNIQKHDPRNAKEPF